MLLTNNMYLLLVIFSFLAYFPYFEKRAIARQWLGKHFPVATNIHTIEELLEAVLYMQSNSM
jgi:hypothetical protein